MKSLLSKIADEDGIFNMYWKIEQKCQKYTKIIGTFIILSQTEMIPSLIYSIYNINVGNLDTSTWILPLSIGFPISTETIWGWYLMWLSELFIGYGYSVCTSTATSYFVSICLYIGAVCDHFDFQMRTIGNDIEKNVEVENSAKCHEKYTKMREMIHKAIEIQVEVYE